MNARAFLKQKNFKIKAKAIRFESVKFMTDLEKSKVYVAFVKLLNNHFKFTLFKKNLYYHFSTHCGFSAHNNLHGFYGEYFETAANYHFNVNGYSNPMNEYAGNLNVSSDLSHGELFYAIYEEINGARYGLGEFYDQLINPGWNDDYRDLNDAIKDAFSEYMEIWREDIKKAVKAYSKFCEDEKVAELIVEQKTIAITQKRLDESMTSIEETLQEEAKATLVEHESVNSVNNKTQLSLFDFAA